MQKAYIRWIIAIFITLTAAVYQRLTGPTHPIRGYVNIDNSEVSFKFESIDFKEVNFELRLFQVLERLENFDFLVSSG